MIEIHYTTEDIKEFKRLVHAGSSPGNLTRVMSRIDMRDFISLHGRGKCDAMYKVIENGEEIKGNV